MINILLIGSHYSINVSLKLLLSYMGFKVRVSRSTDEARWLLTSGHFNAVVFYIHDQHDSAFTTMKNLRQMNTKISQTPVLYLGMRGYSDAMTKGCTPIDDFLLVPFSYKRLKERLQNLDQKKTTPQRPLLFSGLQINEKERTLSIKEKMINLGTIEMKILMLLAQKAGNVVTFENLYQVIEQENTRLTTRVFMQVSNLRKKLEYAGVESIKIKLVRGGYSLQVLN